jgi:Xaa-Pro aminopeptidase
LIEDLDKEMQARGIDGIVGFGESTLADPDLTYAVGGALARGGFYFKKMGRPPLLLVDGVDYGSAKRLGRVKRIETLTQWDYERLQRQYPRRADAWARLVAAVLRKESVRGKVVLFGRNDLGKGLEFAGALRRLGIQVVRPRSPSILETVRDTKTPGEIANLNAVAWKTSEIVNYVMRSLRNTKEKRGHLQVGKKRATVGLIKSMIASKLASEGLVAPEGTIFAIGPSGADPHNLGTPTAEIRKGRLIVFDIFPQAASGYWFDLTRTFLLGRAPRKARKMYETVQDAQGEVLDYLRAGVSGDGAIRLACDIIERAGFRTVRLIFDGKTRRICSGFTHALGHGVGLSIGESPYLSFTSKSPLKAGEVVTIEPGIYFPGYGGVRLEDTVLIKSKGIENLTHIDKELELT